MPFRMNLSNKSVSAPEAPGGSDLKKGSFLRRSGDSKYQEVEDFLFNVKGEKAGLENSWKLGRLFGDPGSNYEIVHIAGTNGKGTTSTYLAKILERAGYRVGLFNSPHVDRFTERIRVNSKEIDRDFIIETVRFIRSIRDFHPTFFEINSIMALHYFREMKVDVAIVEAGVGGRLDATNVVNPLLSLITTIGKDHEATLGSSCEEIAFEKCGIIKRDVPVIAGRMPASAKKVITEIAATMHSRLMVEGRDFTVRIHGDHSFDIEGAGSTFQGLELDRSGDHLRENVCLSVLASRHFKRVDGFPVREALLRNDILPARSELIEVFPGKPVLLDVCHNLDSAVAFCKMVKEYFEHFKHITVLAGMLINKPYEAMIREFLKVSDRCVLTTFSYHRCFDPGSISKELLSRVVIIKDLKMALRYVFDECPQSEPVCVVGSFYLLSEVRKLLRGEEGEKVWSVPRHNINI